MPSVGGAWAAPRRGDSLKRILLAAVAAVALGAFAVPASAGQVCLTTDINVNGTALRTNGENCVDTP